MIGLGKLGLPMAAACASRGYPVIGMDHDPVKIEQFHQGQFPSEPGLADLVKAHRASLEMTMDESRVLESFLSFVIVPTPSQKNGAFSNQYVEKVFRKLGKQLKKSTSFHVISLVSTVLPGSMEGLKKILEKSSGKVCGRDFGLCYNPAFIALGSVIHNFLNPDLVLIGESDPKSGAIVENFFKEFCMNQPSVQRMNFINAEITKISVNTYVTMKISFGNLLARLCERLPNADAAVVAQALGKDARIGPKYLKGALGYGGPCFPRDNKAFSHVAKKAGFRAFSSEAADRMNQLQVGWLLGILESVLRSGDTVGILGLSYKENTDVIEESQGILLAQALIEKGIRTWVYDPSALAGAKLVLRDRVDYAASLPECLQQADVLAIMTPWAPFAAIQPEDLARFKKRKVLIDCWQQLKGKHFESPVQHILLGQFLPIPSAHLSQVEV